MYKTATTKAILQAAPKKTLKKQNFLSPPTVLKRADVQITRRNTQRQKRRYTAKRLAAQPRALPIEPDTCKPKEAG